MTDVPTPAWVEDPPFDDPLRQSLYNAIHQVRHEFTEVPPDEKWSPVYEKWATNMDNPDEEFIVTGTSAAINDGYCKVFAERVHELLGHPSDVTVQSQGVTHTWLEYDGRCYDAEAPEGVSHPSELPVFNR